MEAPQLLPDDVFVKLPNLLDYSKDGLSLGVAMVAEAKVLETLQRHPHWNICAYFDCVQWSDCITGLAMKRYKHTLDKAV